MNDCDHIFTLSIFPPHAYLCRCGARGFLDPATGRVELSRLRAQPLPVRRPPGPQEPRHAPA